MKFAGRRVFPRMLLTAFLVVLMLIPLAAFAEGTGDPVSPDIGYNIETEEYTLIHNDDNWTMKLTHLKLKMTISGDAGVDWYVIFPAPWVKGDLALTVSGEFDIEIRTAGEYRYSFLRNIIPSWVYKLPIIHTFDPKGDFVAKASQPMKISGKFTDTIHYTGGMPIWKSDLTQDASFEVTHVEPKNQNPATFYIGTDSALALKMIYAKIAKYEIFGPVIELNSYWNAGISGKDVQLKKDEWEAAGNYIDDSITELHSCTENGRAGCVSGKVEESNSVRGDAHYRMRIAGYTLLHADYTFKNR